MTILLLVRHGENNWVKENRLAGWTPGVLLNDNGHRQAAALSGRLAELPVKAVFSSPLERCLETARHVAAPHDLPVLELPAMGEVRYGQWEGRPIKELSKLPQWHAVQHFPSRFAFPEGESLRGVQARAVDQLEQLCHDHPHDMIVVVSHADVIKLVLAHYLGMHVDLFQRIGLAPASVSVVALTARGSVHVLRVNDDGPIQAPPPRAVETDQSEEEQPNGHAH